MLEEELTYLAKAVESIEGAESEYANGRYNNCVNRCYYSCFQAAVHALDVAGISAPSSNRTTWSHEAVQGTFARELINRRKVYPSDLRDVLPRVYLLRETADYKRDAVSEVQAARALRRTRTFLQAIRRRGGEDDE